MYAYNHPRIRKECQDFC